MSVTILIGLVFMLVGGLIAFTGYLIRFKKQLWLIAGYNPDEVKDKDGMALWVGSGILIIGILEGLCGVLILLFPALISVFGVLFFLATVLGVLTLFTKISKFVK